MGHADTQRQRRRRRRRWRVRGAGASVGRLFCWRSFARCAVKPLWQGLTSDDGALSTSAARARRKGPTFAPAGGLLAANRRASSVAPSNRLSAPAAAARRNDTKRDPLCYTLCSLSPSACAQVRRASEATPPPSHSRRMPGTFVSAVWRSFVFVPRDSRIDGRF
uniref:Uncharacterized protein n=1 Tax=Plectus sambesii TaxID=2011161 RepID=A0A914VD99_9BILA